MPTPVPHFVYLVERISSPPENAVEEITWDAVVVARSAWVARKMFPRVLVVGDGPRPVTLHPMAEHVRVEDGLKLRATRIGVADRPVERRLVYSIRIE